LKLGKKRVTRRRPRGTSLRAATGFEDFVQFVDDELVLIVGKMTIGIEFLEFSGDGFRASIAIFFDMGSFAAGAGEGMDKACEGPSVAAQFIVEIATLEAHGHKDPRDGELESAFIEFSDVKIIQEINRRFLVGTKALDPVLLEEPVLVGGAGVPIRDVF